MSTHRGLGCRKVCERSCANTSPRKKQMVRRRIGPVAAFRTALVVPALPKTRSGKVLRGTMQKIADAEDYKLPATIEDSSVLTEIYEVLRQVGYAKAGS